MGAGVAGERVAHKAEVILGGKRRGGRLGDVAAAGGGRAERARAALRGVRKGDQGGGHGARGGRWGVWVEQGLELFAREGGGGGVTGEVGGGAGEMEKDVVGLGGVEEGDEGACFGVVDEAHVEGEGEGVSVRRKGGADGMEDADAEGEGAMGREGDEEVLGVGAVRCEGGERGGGAGDGDVAGKGGWGQRAGKVRDMERGGGGEEVSDGRRGGEVQKGL